MDTKQSPKRKLDDMPELDPKRPKLTSSSYIVIRKVDSKKHWDFISVEAATKALLQWHTKALKSHPTLKCSTSEPITPDLVTIFVDSGEVLEFNATDEEEEYLVGFTFHSENFNDSLDCFMDQYWIRGEDGTTPVVKITLEWDEHGDETFYFANNQIAARALYHWLEDNHDDEDRDFNLSKCRSLISYNKSITFRKSFDTPAVGCSGLSTYLIIRIKHEDDGAEKCTEIDSKYDQCFT